MLHHGGCRVPSAVRRASPGTQGPAAASPGPSGTRDPSLRPRAEEQAPPHPGRPTHASTRRIPVRRPPSARLPQQAQTRCLSPNARLGHEAKTRSSGRGTSRFQRNGSEHRQPPGAPLREGAGHLHGTAGAVLTHPRAARTSAGSGLPPRGQRCPGPPGGTGRRSGFPADRSSCRRADPPGGRRCPEPRGGAGAGGRSPPGTGGKGGGRHGLGNPARPCAAARETWQ